MTARASSWSTRCRTWAAPTSPSSGPPRPSRRSGTRTSTLNTSFDINDRYILDGLIRRDGSSLFGPESRWQTYYRVSGAWRANEDLKINGIDELRLRACYGTAGLRPGFDAQYEVLTPVGGAFNKTTLGNKFLKPAHSAEFEAGFNLEFGGSQFTIEYTYSKKNTKDQILLVALPSVVGFAQQWQNTGALESNTHEISLGAQLINTRSVAWQLNIVGDRTRQVITDWTLPVRLYGFGQMPAVFYLNKGATLGEMRGQRAVQVRQLRHRRHARLRDLRRPGQEGGLGRRADLGSGQPHRQRGRLRRPQEHVADHRRAAAQLRELPRVERRRHLQVDDRHPHDRRRQSGLQPVVLAAPSTTSG